MWPAAMNGSQAQHQYAQVPTSGGRPPLQAAGTAMTAKDQVVASADWHTMDAEGLLQKYSVPQLHGLQGRIR